MERLIQLSFVFFSFLFIVTQILIPGLKDTQMFPLFNRSNISKRKTEAKDTLDKIDEIKKVVELETKVNEEVSKLPQRESSDFLKDVLK